MKNVNSKFLKNEEMINLLFLVFTRGKLVYAYIHNAYIYMHALIHRLITHLIHKIGILNRTGKYGPTAFDVPILKNFTLDAFQKMQT